MEYKEYIDAIQKQLELMSAKEMKEWIYNYAKSIGKDGRAYFLELLQQKQNSQYNLTFDKVSFDEFVEKIEYNRLIMLYDEGYDDYGYSDYFSRVFYDPRQIADTMMNYVQLAFDFLQEANYEITNYIFRHLLRLKVLGICEELDEEEDFDFFDLIDNELINNVDETELIKAYAYSIMQGNGNCKELYDLLERDNQIQLTDVLAYGTKEIENIDDLIQNFIEYLMSIEGDRAAQLLEDACLFLGGVDKLTEVARHCFKIHPSLYKMVCSKYVELEKYNDAKNIAREACETIKEDLKIKADIADIILSFDKDDYFLEVAFLFNPNINHFFNMYMNITNFQKVKDNFINHVYHDSRYVENSYYKEELSIVGLTNELKDLYRFMFGEFKDVLNQYFINTNESYLKDVFIQILLLLFKPEAPCYVADNSGTRSLEMLLNWRTTNTMTFEECFSYWKNRNKMSNDLRKHCIQQLEKEVNQLAERIVGGGDRKGYYGVASKIVILGEILYSMGKVSSVEAFCEVYRTRYNSKRAFKQDLNENLRRN